MTYPATNPGGFSKDPEIPSSEVGQRDAVSPCRPCVGSDFVAEIPNFRAFRVAMTKHRAN
jgi:hypothetical protein